MPPRRSCFRLGSDLFLGAFARFNATTAFLLQVLLKYKASPLVSVSMPPRRSCFLRRLRNQTGVPIVSMPPRRSCFPDPGPATDQSTNRFQCHHGVPASRNTFLSILLREGFQCHHGVPASTSRAPPARRRPWFQCHHGVPASGSLTRVCWCG